MTRRFLRCRSILTLSLVLSLTWCAVALAQEDEDSDELLLDGRPLENAIVDRDSAFRIRGEIKISSDETDLIDDDINYARFPSEIYAGEVRLFRYDRLNLTVSHYDWKSEQDLDQSFWSWKIYVPFEDKWLSHVNVKYRKQQTDEGEDRDYHYIAIGNSFANGVYSRLQYRHASQDGSSYSHQLSEYVSWRPLTGLRLGGQVAVANTDGIGGLGPWYADLFGSVYLVEETTSLSGKVRYYDTAGDLEYQEYNLYLYQRLGNRSLVRLGYRFYRDNQDLDSHAVGIKLKRYFTPRFSAHIGYRYYDHSIGPNFDTALAGFGLLL